MMSSVIGGAMRNPDYWKPARPYLEGIEYTIIKNASTAIRIHPARAAGRCTWADQPVIAGGLFLVRRALAALRWFAMRPRAYLIGSSSTMLGIVIVEPFLGFGVVRVFGVSGSVECLVETGNAAAILGRRVALAGDVPGVGENGIAAADIGQREPVLPAVAEVVEIIDRGLAWPQHIAQPHLGGVGARFGSPVLVGRQAVSALVDRELPEVVIQPSHRGLDDTVQDLERDRGRRLDLAPYHRVSVAQLDTNSGNLVKAVECSAASWRAHAASLAGQSFQFQGRSSSSLEAG